MQQPYYAYDSSLFTTHAGTTLHIDLTTLINNYHYLCQKTPSAQCGAVIKADAYGLGMIPIVKALQKTKCKNFFVAYLDEGIALRSILDPTYNIYILNGLFPHSVKPFIDYHLIPILNDREQLQLWVKLCQEHNYNHPAALQFDTGMSRFGLDHHDMNIIKQQSLLPFEPILLISHLACADNPTHVMNQQQLQEFTSFRTYFPSVPASLSASSGIFLGQAWHFDLVRPGAALYGINPVPGQNNPMQNVVSLRSKILQIRNISTGTTVGYGATFTAHKPLRLAVVSLGYADGFFRSLSNKIYVNHIRYPEIPLPVIGRISMDCFCLDITALPHDHIHIADEIEIIGSQCSIEKLATTANTIGYEILTALGNRFHRIYHET